MQLWGTVAAVNLANLVVTTSSITTVSTRADIYSSTHTTSGLVECLSSHKLGPTHTIVTIARKQHSTGRGLSPTTTSFSSQLPTLPTASIVNGLTQLQRDPISALPLIPYGQDALSSPSTGVSCSTAHAPDFGLTSRDPVTVSNLSAALSSKSDLPASRIPPADIIAAKHATSAPTTDNMVDAQDIQAQVEALFKSTSTSVAGLASDDQQATVGLATAPILPIPSAGRTPSALGAPSQSATANVESASNASQASHLRAHSIPADGLTSPSTVSSAAALVESTSALGPSFQNTFAQYQFPQNSDRALNDASRLQLPPSSSPNDNNTTGQQKAPELGAMTKEEEERVADALIADIVASDVVPDVTPQQHRPDPLPGADLAAAAKAIGLEADPDLLDGMSEDQRALAVAIRRLGAEHSEAAQKAIQQAAAAAARASQELARAAAKEQGHSADAGAAAGPSTPSSVPSSTTKGSGPVKRFPCPKCDKAFARAYNLNTHLSTHDPDPNRSKPFACPYPSCKSEGGRSFSRKHDLQRHVASIHENEAEPGIHGDPEQVVGGQTGGLVSLGLGTPGKKFRCHSCGRSFVRRDACNRHQCDGKDRHSPRTSKSPSSTPYSSSVSPRPSTSQHAFSNHSVTLPSASPMSSSPAPTAVGVHVARDSHSPIGSGPAKYAPSRPSSSLSKEVQAVAQQLHARVQAQSPGSQGHASSQRTASPLPNGERRNFPLSAISLYASTSTSSMHSPSSSSSSGGKAQIAK